MATLAEVLRSPKPPAVLSIPPSAWATGWAGRPRHAVTVGLRRLSDDDLQAARAQASARVHKHYACANCNAPTSTLEQLDAFNDALLHVAVGRGVCVSTDVSVTYFDREDDDVRTRMTPEGARYVWDALERLHISDSPITPPATTDDLVDLGLLLADPTVFVGAPADRALRARKLATFLLAELRTFAQTSE